MHVGLLSAHAHDYMDVLVKVAIMQMQGTHWVCALGALVFVMHILK